jgi:hypothetical protein
VRPKQQYWAFVGRIPEGENGYWATPQPATRKQAVAQFKSFLAAENGLTQSCEMKLKLAYGSAYVLDGLFSSDSPITTHGGIQ